MKIDPAKIYMMLHITGPQYERDSLPRLPYPQFENIAIQYKTDYEFARQLVPDCYLVDDEPAVTVVFGYHNGLKFLAENGYSIVTFQISAKFEGVKNRIIGDYIPVMFENRTTSILGGREYLAIRK